MKYIPTTEKLAVELTEKGVLVLTLNDPETKNALDPQMQNDLLEHLSNAQTDASIKAVIITGAAGAFCSGANVKAFGARAQADLEAAKNAPQPTPWEVLDPAFAAGKSRQPNNASKAPEIIQLITNLPKPTFAAVDGPAYGLGCGLALACDFRVVNSVAKFSEAFIKHGLIPGDGSTWLLPKLIGRSAALWLQMTGDAIEAKQALECGMANWISEEDSSLGKAIELATRLADGPSLAIGMVKLLVNRAEDQTLKEHFALTTRAQEIARTSADHREAIDASKSKRKPVYSGR